MDTKQTILLFGAAALAFVAYSGFTKNQQLQYAQQYQQQTPPTERTKINWQSILNAIATGIEVFGKSKEGVGSTELITLIDPQKYSITTSQF